MGGGEVSALRHRPGRLARKRKGPVPRLPEATGHYLRTSKEGDKVRVLQWRQANYCEGRILLRTREFVERGVQDGQGQCVDQWHLKAGNH